VNELTKSEIKNLNDRVDSLSIDSLEPKPANTDSKERARQAWIFAHLTEEEGLEAVTRFKQFMDFRSDTATEQEIDVAEQELNSYQALISIATERAKKEEDSSRKEWIDKVIRAENIRHVQRLMTEAEHDELMELNEWFANRTHFHLETGKLGHW
jgi:hypothetical protein